MYIISTLLTAALCSAFENNVWFEMHLFCTRENLFLSNKYAILIHKFNCACVRACVHIYIGDELDKYHTLTHARPLHSFKIIQ